MKYIYAFAVLRFSSPIDAPTIPVYNIFVIGKELPPMGRKSTHITETKSKLIFQNAILRFKDASLNISDGDIIFRDITERDYGIDGLIEIFENGETTGKIAHIQLKGTEKTIKKLVRSDEVSCPGITKSNFGYCRQNNVPVMLVYISVPDEFFYYVDLQPIYRTAIEAIADGKSRTVRIPYTNNSNHLHHFFEIINQYYERTEDRVFEPRKPATIELDPEDQDRDAERNTDRDDESFAEKSYIIGQYSWPSDGEHKQVNPKGETLKSGYWEDGELLRGVEYDWLIRIIQGALIYKPECPEDPYDATEDFAYEKIEQYGMECLTPLFMAEVYIEREGLESYYIVDMEVNGDMEQMVHIRTLKVFLEEKNPKLLKRLERNTAVFQEERR